MRATFRARPVHLLVIVSNLLLLAGCVGIAASGPFQLSVQVTGNGHGTITSSPAGINCSSACTGIFSSGTTVTLTATPEAGSTFAGWSGDCTGSSACTVTLNTNKSVTATVTTSPLLTVSVSGTGTVTSNPSGINCGTACKAPFQSGTQVTLTATPAANSVFTGWGGACAGTGTCNLTLTANTSVSATFTTLPVLTVSVSGTGTVTSNPSGIDCGTTCKASFQSGTQVTLTATPGAGSVFAGWGGACTGTGTCNLTLTADTSVTATFTAVHGLDLINHIIFLAQENRSLDHYFGELRKYWADSGYPDQSYDGLPQFNPASGPPPLYGPPPQNPGCDPNSPPPSDCVFDSNNPITSYHLITQCVENPSPSWNESHVDWDYNDPTGNNPATLNGYVWTAGHDARNNQPPYYDVNGIRAMGYYDGGDLNYYYFMASNFATSDRWFSPVMTRTPPNREYLIAGTSQGHAYPLHSGDQLLTATTIFQELQNAGITWKIYVNPGSTCPGPPYDPHCLLGLSYVQNFQWGHTIPTDYPQNLGTIGPPGTCGSSPCDFENDLANGTLPQVVQIEPASNLGLDEHPSDFDNQPFDSQKGANYVSALINELTASQYWKDSAFIFTFDEFGGFYDHVSPQATVSPDGIPPQDLLSGDVCTKVTGPTCDFTYTGYRVPLIVISPYSKKNYVSHTVADETAVLKLIETRFNVSSLTARDAAQMDMTEFFDFNNPPWMTPPTPPQQNTNGACYLNKLP